jgi:hypothetical protein
MILGWVVQAGPGAVVQGIVSLFAPRDLILQQVVSGFVTTVTTLLFLPIQLIAITLYYFDLRVRKEGYDLETALSQRYATPPPPTGYGAYGGYGGYGQTQPVGGYTQPQPAGDYYQPQPGQTQPTGGYGPPQLGTEPQGQYSGYGAYMKPEQASQETNYGDYTPPETPEKPETPRRPESDSPEQP